MKLSKWIKIVLLLFVFNACGLISNMKDLTQTANDLLNSINSIALQIDAMIESKQITEELGNLIDERLETLAELLNSTIQNNGGFIFDEVNGTVDNAFQNISLLLDQIKTGILDESLPSIINQVSYQLQMNINLISASAEDLIILTFGNTFVLVDKVVNSAFIIISAVLLAIGLFVFALVLFRKERKLNFLRILGLVFMFVYVGFFLAIIVSPQWRGNLIAGFNFGEKYDGVKVNPTITGVYPEKFTIGKDDKIILYGKHLNKIDTLKVLLKTGNTQKYSFPEHTIIVKTQNKIVLGNFKSKLNWKVPIFEQFKIDMGPAAQTILNSTGYIKYAEQINFEMFPMVRMNLPSTVQPIRGAINTRMQPNLRLRTNISLPQMETRKLDVAKLNLGAIQGVALYSKIKDYFQQKFGLPEGDYGITAMNGMVQVESPQLITIINPPPPAPKPDIFPLEIKWTGNTIPVTMSQATLDILLGFTHPEEIKREFKIQLTSNPPIPSLRNVEVPMGHVAAAQSGNQVWVTSRSFEAPAHGNYTITARIDHDNLIPEKNETNNMLERTLPVQRYVYDVKVIFQTFTSLKNYDDSPGPEDEYRIQVHVSATNHTNWSFAYDKNGEPGHNYAINKENLYTNMLPGYAFTCSTSGREADDGLKDGDDYMGEATVTYPLHDDPTDGKNEKEYSMVLNTGGYKIIGKYIVTRRVQ